METPNKTNPLEQKLFQKDWLDILFEYRNKAYGAYVLRKDYVETLTKSLLFTLGVLFIVFGGAYASTYFSKVIDDAKKTKKADFVMTPPPDLANEPPPPPPPPMPEQVRIDKFTPPVIVEDNTVTAEDEPKPVEDIVRVGTEDVKGVETEVIVPVESGPVSQDDNKVFSMVEVSQQAEFAGLAAFLEKNLEYPETEKEMENQGTVKVSFTVEKSGDITAVKVVKSSGYPALDEEGVRVVKMMPKWKPAEYNGAKVRMQYILPIGFTL